ncbi:Tetratricopeptide repeat protein [Photobacterium toruni]|uniref:Tetratricopeptide repeat protein n=2 Tax=Photobacterium toruni TaxID=1935446 RepID=A0A1T4SGJ1_9GAMM|nr:Tetratricopeptide repeat protein [Photobacterium toruni]
MFSCLSMMISTVTMPVMAATDDSVSTSVITDHDEQSVYDDGYNKGYEQALAEEHQKQKIVSPPIKSELSIEAVSLTPNELANVEYLNAEKALDQQNSKQAALNLESALYYRPDWVMARQKLAALYYGRGNVQEAIATLERGLSTQPNQADLRLTLAKLLMNESQFQAALTVLDEKSGHMSIQYLAMRGALAQQLNHNNIALACYQKLIQRAPKDGRWWMGLAIVQERTKAINQALASYQQALDLGNISSSSQLFIQQRLAKIKPQHKA